MWLVWTNHLVIKNVGSHCCHWILRNWGKNIHESLYHTPTVGHSWIWDSPLSQVVSTFLPYPFTIWNENPTENARSPRNSPELSKNTSLSVISWKFGIPRTISQKSPIKQVAFPNWKRYLVLALFGGWKRQQYILLTDLDIHVRKCSKHSIFYEICGRWERWPLFPKSVEKNTIRSHKSS